MTLYEKIKNKSPEELAEYFSQKFICPDKFEQYRPSRCTDCRQCWLDFLNTEVPDAEA